MGFNAGLRAGSAVVIGHEYRGAAFIINPPKKVIEFSIVQRLRVFVINNRLIHTKEK